MIIQEKSLHLQGMSKKHYIFFLAPTFWRLLLTIIVLLAASHPMMGETADSLYNIFLNSPESQKVEVANTVFKILYQQQHIDTILQFEIPARAATIETRLHEAMAVFYFEQGLYSASLEAGKRGAKLLVSIKDDQLKSDVLGAVANAHFRLGNYEDAIKTLMEVYRLDKEIGDKTLISSDLNTLAAIFLSIEQPVPGLRYINEAIAIERELQRTDRLAVRLGMAAELYLINQETEKAMDAINEAFDIDHKEGRKDKAAVRLIQKAAILEHESRLKEAMDCIHQALPQLEEANAIYSLAVAYNQLGSINEKQGNHQEATANFKKALELSIKCGSPKTERIAEYGLWQSMRETNPNAALLHLERYTLLNDSMQSRIKTAQLYMMDPSVLENGKSVNGEDGHVSSKRMLWGGAAFIALLLVALGIAFFTWLQNRRSRQMQREIQAMRSHLITNITNTLQTPLTVVLSAGQHLLEEKRASLDDNKKTGEMIVRHGNNMLGLINELLDIDKAKTAVDQPEYKPGNIVMFTRQLVENHVEAAKKNKVFLEFNCPHNEILVFFAPDCVRKIVHCLIDNAMKFTPSKGSITVSLNRLDTSHLTLTVKDTGKGIPVEERERIFEPFTQSANGDDAVGTAIDLSLVNQLVQFMNGTIRFDSELNQGTTFTIDFPVRPAENNVVGTNEDGHSFAEQRIMPSGSKRQGGPLVFVVENNEDVAFFIGSLLQNDYEIRFARDGQEAFNNAQELVPALIITNIMMPVMNGKSLIRELRANESLSHIPVIALTSDYSEQERLACIEAGADVVLVKPFNSTELKLQACHLISQRAKLREQLTRTVNNHIDSDKPKSKLAKEDQEFLNRLIDIIHVQMAKDDIDIDHIAAAMSLSPKQLRMRVMSITGLRPIAYVLQVRLNYARRLVANDSISLTTIANKCGFQTLSHFSKAFKQQFGMSPLQYRKYQDDPSRLQQNKNP